VFCSGIHEVCGSEEEKERGHPMSDVFQKVEQKREGEQK